MPPGTFVTEQPGILSPAPLYASAGPVRLRPLWAALPGLAVAGLMLLYSVPATKRNPADLPAALVQLFAIVICLLSYVYYFMCVHRIIRVLQREPGWSVDYTPAGAVWRQFIPFYGLVFNYRWTGDVADYTKWRLGTESWAGGRAGLWAFLCLLLGFILSNFLFPVGLAIVFGGLFLLDVPLRRALNAPAPESGAPGYNGTLGLR